MRSTKSSRLSELLYKIFLFQPTRHCIPKLSAGFEKPFKTMTRVNFYIKKLIEDKYIKEQPVKTDADGRKPRLLYLTPRAAEVCPKLREIAAHHLKKKHLPGFKPIPVNETEHQLGLAEFGAELYASLAKLNPLPQILAELPTGYFKAKVNVYDRKGKIKAKEKEIIPDFTLAIRWNHKAYLFFVELQNQTGLIISHSSTTIGRSFQYKLSKYKAFFNSFRNHPEIRRIERTHHCKFEGFKVLIPVIHKSQTHLENLMAANTSNGFDNTFLFAHLENLEDRNLMTEPCWLNRHQKPLSIELI